MRLPSHAKTFVRNLGLVLHLPAALAVLGALVAAGWREWDGVSAMLVCAAVSLSVGQALYRPLRRHRSERDAPARVTAALGWLAAIAACAIPFWAFPLFASELSSTTAAFAHPLNALFEATSGLTSTGLTVSENPALLPRTLQFWRSLRSTTA